MWQGWCPPFHETKKHACGIRYLAILTTLGVLTWASTRLVLSLWPLLRGRVHWQTLTWLRNPVMPEAAPLTPAAGSRMGLSLQQHGQAQSQPQPADARLTDEGAAAFALTRGSAATPEQPSQLANPEPAPTSTTEPDPLSTVPERDTASALASGFQSESQHSSTGTSSEPAPGTSAASPGASSDPASMHEQGARFQPLDAGTDLAAPSSPGAEGSIGSARSVLPVGFSGPDWLTLGTVNYITLAHEGIPTPFLALNADGPTVDCCAAFEVRFLQSLLLHRKH